MVLLSTPVSLSLHHNTFQSSLPPDTLSFFTVYMCHYVNPHSVTTYLSGISQQLEPYFPAVREAWNSSLVCRTLWGCMRMRGTTTIWKRPLSTNDLHHVSLHYQNLCSHDDKLFITMLFTGFFGLLCWGEMTFPDNSTQLEKSYTLQHCPHNKLTVWILLTQT